MADHNVSGFSIFNPNPVALERLSSFPSTGAIHHMDDTPPDVEDLDVDEGAADGSPRKANGHNAAAASTARSAWGCSRVNGDEDHKEPSAASPRFRATALLGRPKDDFSKRVEGEVARTGVGMRRLYDTLDPALKDRYPVDKLVPLCIDMKRRDELTPEIIAAVTAAYRQLPDKGEAPDVRVSPTAIRHGVKDGQHFVPSSDADLPPSWPVPVPTQPVDTPSPEGALAAAVKKEFNLRVDRLGRVEIEAFREMAHAEKERTGLGAMAIYVQLVPELREKYNRGKLANCFTKGVPLRWVPVDLALGVQDVYSQQPSKPGYSGNEPSA